MYNTVCQNCGRRSERDSDFLEIELNIEVHRSPAILSLTAGINAYCICRIMPLYRSAWLRYWSLKSCPETTSALDDRSILLP